MWVAGVTLAALFAGGGAWTSREQFAYARIATGYAAKQTCSCLHVSGRSLESCIADFPEDVRNNITVTQSGFDGREVRASVLLGLVSAEAVSHPDYGCSLSN
jgi:hypothetical protein